MTQANRAASKALSCANPLGPAPRIAILVVDKIYSFVAKLVHIMRYSGVIFLILS